MKSRYLSALLTVGLLWSSGVGAAEPAMPQPPYEHGADTNLPNGVIGVSLQVGAERIGDPAVLYVAMVHPEGPAHQTGLMHGDEIVTVDGTAVSGKSYEQVVRMIRGTAGTPVKLGVKGERGTREVSITRVAADSLSKGPSGPHGNPAR
jgi:C-terminal processing protease CtpA/Prc